MKDVTNKGVFFGRKGTILQQRRLKEFRLDWTIVEQLGCSRQSEGFLIVYHFSSGANDIVKCWDVVVVAILGAVVCRSRTPCDVFRRCAVSSYMLLSIPESFWLETTEFISFENTLWIKEQRSRVALSIRF